MRVTFKAMLAPMLAAALAVAPALAQRPQPTAAEAGSFLREADHRVAGIVYQLGVAGRDHCPEAFPLTGLSFHHLAEYRPQDRPEAIRRYGLDAGIGVLSVQPGSPAAQAGIAAGDVLVAANGTRFRS
ncbi:MAG: PDZ domain-containing protein, partial [Pseudomonadota bacterium]|nr:PDZ domain-containing protein [Pseudomonadota bacterium]